MDRGAETRRRVLFIESALERTGWDLPEIFEDWELGGQVELDFVGFDFKAVCLCLDIVDLAELISTY